jgi:hypothetical protein
MQPDPADRNHDPSSQVNQPQSQGLYLSPSAAGPGGAEPQFLLKT